MERKTMGESYELAVKDEGNPDENAGSEPMDDPLQLRGKDAANAVRLARAAPHPDFERIYRRITSGDVADSSEVRLLLLTHLIYVAYRDLKEAISL
jgi:hypothetical protein